MATFHGLYYPYINFQDEGWLNTGALYWDSIGRIVGIDIPLGDSDDVKRLIDAGFVQDRRPELSTKQEVAKPFSALLASRGEALLQKFRVDAITSESDLVVVFDEKMDAELLKDLLALKLVRTEGRWIEIHRRLGDVYITALAEAMAPRIGARPLAEKGTDHVAISGLTLERLTDALLNDDGMRPRPQHQDTELEEAMATIALRYVVPADPDSIPASEIVSFRNKYQEERGQFQAEVAKIIKELGYIKEMTNPDDVIRHLQAEYDKRLAGKVKRLERAMQTVGWNTVENAMAASWAVPAGLSAVFAVLGLASGAVTGAAGVAFAGWSMLRKRRKAMDDLLKPSAEAYLYRAKSALSPQALASEVYADGRMFLP
jgi:hypothetical protein